MRISEIFVFSSRQISRFLFSGGLATAIHWLTMTLFVVLGITPVLATSIGACLGAISNYFLQFHLTFSRQTSHQAALSPYVITVAVSWLTNSLLFYVLTSIWQMNIIFAQLLTTAVLALTNFILYKTVVFNEHHV